MRVVFLPSLIAPVVEGRCFGGAEMAALDLAEGIASRGHRVRLIGLPGSGGVGLEPWIVAQGTPILRPGEAPARETGIVAPFDALLSELERGELEILHLHLHDRAALLLADRIARARPGVVVISSLHMAAVFAETAETVHALWRAESPVIFTAPSRFALESYGIAADGRRAFVVSNGIDVEAIAFAAEAPRDGRLAWAGRRSREKGLLEALEIARASGRPISVCGSRGDAEEEQELAARMQAMPAGIVEELGLLPRAEVPRLFARSAAVLVSSSIAEAQPLVAMEALAAGTPVIAFDAGALREVIDDGVTGFVVPAGDGIAAASRVEQIGTLSRARCRQTAVERFGRSRMLDRFEAIYRRAAS